MAHVTLATNRYSVPSSYAGGTLTLVADDDVVRLIDGTTEVARHPRSWGKHQRVEDPAHRQDLVQQRRGAHAAPIREALFDEVPELRILFERAVERGRNMGSMTARIKVLRNLYGASIFADTVHLMVEQGTHDPGALALLCEQARKRRNMPIPLPVPVPSRVIDRDVETRPLASYDERTGESS